MFDRQGNLLWSYETGCYVESVSISSDGSYIAAGSGDDKVYMFDRQGNLLWNYKTGRSVYSVSISSDGSCIAAESFKDDKVYLFDRAGNLLWSYETGSWVWSVSISSDDSCIAAGSGDDKVYLFDRQGNLLWNYKTGYYVLSVSISSDGSCIAAGSQDDKVYLFASVQVIIENAKEAISSVREKGYNVKEAESLLSQAEQAFGAGDYAEARELAYRANALALDIDQDGVPNDSDFAPTIKNIYVYGAIAVLVIAFAGACFVFARNIKRRKEYQAKVREYKAKYEQLKAEGFEPDEELEELLK